MISETVNTALVFKALCQMGTEIRITGDTADTYPCNSFSDPDGCVLEYWHSVEQFENH